MRQRHTVVVLYGPKGAGKSWVAEELERRGGVQHVDVDRMVLELLDRGRLPDPEQGWLEEVEAEVRRVASEHLLVSVEATGAWAGDWTLADDLAADGFRVVLVWVTAPLEVTLDRVAHRRSRKVAVSLKEARWIHAEATRRAAAHAFTAVVDTTGGAGTQPAERSPDRAALKPPRPHISRVRAGRATLPRPARPGRAMRPVSGQGMSVG